MHAHGAGPEREEAGRLVAGSEIRDKILIDMVIEAMTTNETSFFPGRRALRCLRQHILPTLIERTGTRSEDPDLVRCVFVGPGALFPRDLDPGAFPEAGQLERQHPGDRPLAEMAAKTEKGEYSQLEVNRGMPAPLLAKHFTKRRSLAGQRRRPQADPLPHAQPARVLRRDSLGRHRVHPERADLLRAGPGEGDPGQDPEGAGPGWIPLPGRRREHAQPGHPLQRLDLARSGCFQLEGD